MNPEPPPITIVDPHAPAGTADLLSSGRDPWRPSPRQVLAAVAVILLAGLVTGVVAQVRHVLHEHALDRQALRDVRVTVGVDELDPGAFIDAPDGSLALNVFNHGRAMIRVRTVRLDDRPPFQVVTGSDVLPGGLTTVTLTLSGECAPGAGRTAHRVTLQLTTDRGQHVTKEQRLTSDELLNTHERQRCGTQTPTEAVGWSLVSARTRGRWVEAVYDLRNTSTLPLSITALTVPRGLRAVLPPLPLVLPPADAPQTTGPSRQVLVRLQVTSCQGFNAGLQGPDGFAAKLPARLHGSLEDEDWDLPLQTEVETGFGVDAPDAQLKLMEFCPEFFFG